MTLLSIPLATVLAMVVQNPDVARVNLVSPVIAQDVGVVAHVDLLKWKPEPFLRRTLGQMADEQEVATAAKVVGTWVDALKKAGGKDLYFLVDLADMPGMPVVAIPLSPGGDAAAIAKVLLGEVASGPIRWPSCETIRGVVVAGTPEAVARIKADKPINRPEVLESLSAGAGSPVTVAIVPSNTMRRVINETVPTLPPQLGGGSTKSITQGLKWATLSMEFDPRSTLKTWIQAKDESSAKEIENLLQTGLGLLAQMVKQDRTMAPLAMAIGELKPKTSGNRVTMETDLEKAAALVAIPLGQARAASSRTQSVNNMKQMGLAMHNYLDKNNTFPAAYSVSKDGKPLLSWRVHILPFLDQKPLYDQFHLDEPWDSEHNKALISQLPSTYISPASSKTLRAQGMTTYLTPRGPGTMFPGATGVKIQEITDGTSNTIMTIEASDKSAVIWTKPDDWEMGAAPDLATLFGHYAGGTNFGFADGSVKFIKDTINLKVLQSLLTMKAGEVISANDY